MAIKKFGKPQNLDDVEKQFQDMRDNLSLQDLRAGDVRKEAPTDKTLDKTRYTIAEEGGVPTIYYRATDGKIYKWNGTAA